MSKAKGLAIFGVGLFLGKVGVSKLIHSLYITVIIFLLVFGGIESMNNYMNLLITDNVCQAKE